MFNGTLDTFEQTSFSQDRPPNSALARVCSSTRLRTFQTLGLQYYCDSADFRSAST